MAETQIDIPKTAKTGWWAGLSAAELKGVYKNVYELGTLSKAHYIVELKPLDPDSVKEGGRFELISALKQDGTGWALPWLATSVDFGLLDAQADSVQAGVHQLNYITGNSSSEVQVTFLETANADVIRMVKAIKQAMFHRDGTQGLPFDYLLEMRVALFDRQNRNTRPAEFNWIVALTGGQLDFSGADRDPLQIPLTFTKMYPVMLGNTGDW